MIIKVNYTVSDVYMSTSISPVYIKVVYSGTSGGGGTWGSITGTLSNQTDLQAALDDKVPYTGATANVNLGEFQLATGQVSFDQTPTGTAGVGVMRWNDSDGTVDLGLKGGNVTLQVGQEQLIRVVNKTGSNLLESQYKVCRVRTQAEGGAQGQRLAVVLAQANNKANHSGVLGIVTENIDNNQQGFITNFGNVQSVNTTGSLQGETWADGDVLWLSETFAGGLTNIEPTTHPVQIGYVVYAHVNNGKIFVSLEEGVDELKELHDVAASTPTNNDALIYESATSLWKNKTIASALGYTPVPPSRTLTINGTAYDLSADRSWTISSDNIYTANGTLTSARTLTSGGFPLTFTGSNTAATAIARGLNLTHTLVASANSDVLVGLDINPTFTNGAFSNVANIGLRVSNSYLVVAGDYFPGTILPAKGLVFEASGGSARISSRFTSAAAALTISSSALTISSGATINGSLQVGGTDNNFFQFSKVYYTVPTGGIFASFGRNLSAANDMVLYANTGRSLFLSADNIRFTNANEVTERMRLTSAGRLLLGTTTESTFLLDVNGTARATELHIAGTNTYSIANGTNPAGNANSILFKTASTTLMSINSTGLTTFSGVDAFLSVVDRSGGAANSMGFYANQNTANLYSQSLLKNILSVGTTNGRITLGITNYNYNGNTSVDGKVNIIGEGSTSATNSLLIRNSSATLLLGVSDNGNVAFGNFTSGAVADISGSTSARASLRIRSGSAPTSPNDGDIWFDGTDLKMRIGGVTKTFTLI